MITRLWFTSCPRSSGAGGAPSTALKNLIEMRESSKGTETTTQLGTVSSRKSTARRSICVKSGWVWFASKGAISVNPSVAWLEKLLKCLQQGLFPLMSCSPCSPLQDIAVGQSASYIDG